jgi:hypothetical protein
MLLENFKKSFDAEKVLRLLGAKQGRRISSASLRRIDLLSGKIERMLKPHLYFRTLKVAEVNRGGFRLADGTGFKSPKIAKALTEAEAVCCFLATVGSDVDMEIQDLMQRRHYADAYVLDAIGSMSAESVVEQFYQRTAKRQAEKNGAVTLRFSPGYCDWPIQAQKPLFQLLTRTDAPDVVLNDSCLMSPRKSVSGLFGLLPSGSKGLNITYNPCKTCTQRDCIARRRN